MSLQGFLTEYFQQFTGRGAKWSDVGLDHVGILLGCCVMWLGGLRVWSRA